MNKSIKGVLSREIKINVDEISIISNSIIHKLVGLSNVRFLIDDIKSIDFSPQESFTEKRHIVFNLVGYDYDRDSFGNKTKNPYCVHFGKSSLPEFQELYDYCMAYKRQKSHSVRNSNSDNSGDIPTQIKKLSDLRDAGILTEEEFKNKKQDLLNRL